MLVWVSSVLGLLSFLDQGLNLSAMSMIPRGATAGGAAARHLIHVIGVRAVGVAVAGGALTLVASPFLTSLAGAGDLPTDEVRVAVMLVSPLLSATILANVAYSIGRALGWVPLSAVLAFASFASTNIVWAVVASSDLAVEVVLLWQVAVQCGSIVLWVALIRMALLRLGARGSGLGTGVTGVGPEVHRFMLWSGVGALGQTTVANGGKLALSYSGGVASLPPFSIALSLSSRLSIVGTAVSTALMPRLARHEGLAADRLNDLGLAVSVALAGAAATVLFWCGDGLLTVWLGEEFAGGAYGPLRILAVGYVGAVVAQVSVTRNDVAPGRVRLSGRLYGAVGVLFGIALVWSLAVGSVTATSVAALTAFALWALGLGAIVLGRSVRTVATTAALWLAGLGVAGGIINLVPEIGLIARVVIVAGVATGAATLAVVESLRRTASLARRAGR
ncbi:MAG: hypothetical protein IPM45_14465 [Acidimicrobiales bacterium]|nr:hypothetical protein [Acidimicrobiales bacterium]